MNTQHTAAHKSRQRMAQPSERRTIDRTAVSFGLMYSGIDGSDVLMGDGTVLDLSHGGLGIRGTHPVKVGMDLTLFLYLPDQEAPLFVIQGCAVWANGHQFGLQFSHMRARERHRLHRFLATFSRPPRSVDVA